jgi:alanine racemase
LMFKEEIVFKGELIWAEIDLDAVVLNARNLKQHIGKETILMAVVKANAYGHGAVVVANAALEGGAERLAVNRVVEGVELRQAGLTVPILVIGYALPSEMATAVQYDLTPTVTTMEVATALSEAASRLGKTIPLHIKVDTGMGRFGLLPGEVVDFVGIVAALPGLRLEGFFTHFSVADLADKTYTHQQFDLYREVVRQVEEAGFALPIKHAANSAAALDLPETHLDMVRCGITLLGMPPSKEVPPAFALRPVMSLKSHVARVRTLPRDSSISYGRTYITSRPTPVALVPVGYGDGYHRLISNRGAVLIGGQRAPIVGRVCMDQLMADVSGLPDVKQDDEVVILGRQGGEEIRAEEIAAWAETINYEVTTSFLPRVTRVYLKGGQVVATRCLANP